MALKPCPFCGNSNLTEGYLRYQEDPVKGRCNFVSSDETFQSDEEREYYVKCQNERCVAHPWVCGYKSKSSARRAWNTRR